MIHILKELLAFTDFQTSGANGLSGIKGMSERHLSLHKPRNTFQICQDIPLGMSAVGRHLNILQ